MWCVFRQLCGVCSDSCVVCGFRQLCGVWVQTAVWCVGSDSCVVCGFRQLCVCSDISVVCVCFDSCVVRADLFSLRSWHRKLHIYACITQTVQMTSFRLRDSGKCDSVLFFDVILFLTRPPCSNGTWARL